MVKKAKHAAKKVDAEAIDGHIAIQVDITGEGEGAFYVEVADGNVNVEPFEYYDNDCKISADGDTVIALLSGKLAAEEALSAGRVTVEGDAGKALSLVNAVKTAPEKKPAAKPKTSSKEAATAKKPSAKKTTTKKIPAKKAVTAKKAPAKKSADSKK